MTKPGTALVTGGSKRIGRSVCLLLAEMGYHVVIHYNNSKNEAIETQKEIESFNYSASTAQADLSNPASYQTFIEDQHNQFQDLSVLINNASIFDQTSFHKTSHKDLMDNFHVHLFAPFSLIQQFAKTVKKGNVINMLDSHISDFKTEYLPYLLSKKSLADLTEIAAMELAPDIRVNGICPGFILPAKGASEQQQKDRLKKIPLKQKGETMDITETVRFLLRNAFITGQIIYCDGGDHLT